MSQQLALFPLQLVAYPGDAVNLHIFEPRYRQLVEHMERDGIRFGIPTVIDGSLRALATEVSLVKVAKRYPSGEVDIRTRGHRVFRIDEFYRVSPGHLYPGGEVTFLPVEHDENPYLNNQIVELTQEIYKVLKVDKTVPTVSEGFRTYDIAHYIGLTLEQEYELLTLRRSKERQHFLINHLERVRPDVKDRLDIRARAKLNGHFKELQPPNF